MTDLPYTYTDSGKDTLAVTKDPSGNRVITVRETLGSKTHQASVYTPTGAEAVKLARAVLAAAGDTGCEVVSIDDYARAWAAAIESAARSMRDRAAEAIVSEEQRYQDTLAHDPTSAHLNGRITGLHRAREIVSAQPLLPDGEDTFDSPAATDADTFEVTQGLEHHHLRTWTTPNSDGDRIAALEEGLRQAQAAIRGLESRRTAPRRPLTPDTDH